MLKFDIDTRAFAFHTLLVLLEHCKTPGQLLVCLLARKNWSKRVLAMVLDVNEAVITRLAKDRQPFDAKLAVRLSQIFDYPAERFLELQHAMDLAMAKFSVASDLTLSLRATLFGELPVIDMVKRGWVDIPDLRDQSLVEKELTRFFGVASLSEIEIFPHAAKKTNVVGPFNPAQLVWLYQAKRIAKDMMVAGRHSPKSIKAAVERLKPLRAVADEIRHVPQILSEAGIRFVIVEKLPSAQIDGVCFWLNDLSPVIAMTLQHDRIDNFWFVLRHECEHIIQRHGVSAVTFDTDLDSSGAAVVEEEAAANAAAADFCVPSAWMQKFMVRKSPFFYDRDIVGFAKTVGVHPGLVEGQLRRRTGRYNQFKNHLVKIKSIVAPNATVDGWGDVAPVDSVE